VTRLILAAVTPDNTPHGYNLTFAFPMLMFVIIGGVLYLLLSRPHRRIPAQPVRLPASRPGPRAGTGAAATGAATAGAATSGAATATDAAAGSADETAAGETAAGETTQHPEESE
jgi:hypothetical protein